MIITLRNKIESCKGRTKNHRKQKRKFKKQQSPIMYSVTNVIEMVPDISVITLNITIPIKRCRFAEWTKKPRPYYMLSIYFKYKNTDRLKEKG
jgi:hypothetical protein